MNRHSQVGGFTLLAILVGFSPSHAAAPVTVVNTTANPVPIQGSTTVSGSVSINGTPNVNVSNTPTVKAQESGSWTVGISGTPNVNVANTPSVNVSNVPTVEIGNSASNPVPVAPTGTQNVNVTNFPAAFNAVAPSRPSDIITLQGSSVACPNASFAGTLIDSVQNADGTIAPLEIPADHVLVITGIELYHSAPLGHVVDMVLYRIATSMFNRITFHSGIADGSGVSTAVTFPNGAVVKSGAHICFAAYDGSTQLFGRYDASVHGFLAPDA